ncbi:complement factor H-related protein 1-like isoform 2-T2 [Menidia menidia]
MFALHVSLEFLNGAHNITFHQRFFFQDNMKLWLLFLFLQLWENLGVSSQNVCFKLPDIPHAHVSEETKKASYQDGDEIHFKCNPGYTSDQSSKYICTSLGWQVVQQGNCFFPASSCSNPPASEGLTIKGFPENESPIPPHHILTFSCDDPGKHLDGSSVLICGKDGQWNNPVPSCRVLKCPVPVIDDNVNVNGDPEDSTVGNLLRFDCKNDNEIMSGPSQIYCAENGQWNEQPPTCEELRCVKPTIEHGYVLSGPPHYKEHQVLNFDCDTDYKRGNERLPQCSKAGSRAVWIPTPECRPIKCQVLLSAEGTSYNPPNRNVFSPNEKLRISCGSDYWIINTKTTETEVTCKDDGKWSSDPKCKEVRCSDPTDPNVYYWGATWGQKKLRSKVQYSCRNGFHKPQGVTKAECTRDGWIPNPLCEGTKCDKPHVENAQIRPEQNSYRNQDKVRIDCLYGDKTFEMTCQRGAWTGMQSCPGSDCSSPPLLDNGDIKHSLKQKYKHDEKVEYLCQAWHIMEGGPFRKCVDGEWTGEITCLKPCTVNEDDMTANNIQLIRGEGKIYLTHGDHITFECTGRKSRVGSVAFRPMCKDGVITLPRCE